MYFVRRAITLASLVVSFSLSALAQRQLAWSTAEIYQKMKKLNVLGSVLYIAAHPDDENTRLISYLSSDKLYRTGYLSLTRGDGGQNLIGDEQSIDLGLIRTQELLAARKVDGGEQFFTRAFDFGYSKNPEETFSIWDKEKILSDVVWIIRKFQPDIIITRFPTTGEGGHGHHTASAILANEAFTAAADPARFPLQLKWVKPWQVKRVLWNNFNFNNPSQELTGFKVDVGGYNIYHGKSYGEIAAESRSQHKSQGFGAAARRGESYEFFQTTKGSAPQYDLMDGNNLTWSRLKGGDKIEKKINEVIAKYNMAKPELSVPALVTIYQEIKKLENSVWKNHKLEEVIQLIAQCSGLYLEATTKEQFAVQTDSIEINFSAISRLAANTTLEKLTIDYIDTSFHHNLEKNRAFEFSKKIFVPESKLSTQPYWLEDKMQAGTYTVENQEKIGQPHPDPAFVVNYTVNIHNEKITYQVPVEYKYTDPVKGEKYQPVFIIPPVTLNISPSLLVFKKEEVKDKNFNVRVNANTAIEKGVTLEIKDDERPKKLKDTLSYKKFESHGFDITINNSNSRINDKQILIFADTYDSILYYNTLRAIDYDHIPNIKYLYTNPVKVLNIDLKTANKKIGYIVGAGDKVPAALQQMDYEVTLLTEKEISSWDLNQFDAIIAGVRAYNVHDWLISYQAKLMSYVANGGNYIVQYNTNSNAGPLRNTQMGPYAFTISRTRVTDENAAVKFVNPHHKALNFPNKITATDFEGWVQERSIYHAEKWDSNYETILSMGDLGEKEDEGSLIIGKYGKGYFTYTGLVFFRELPAAVPGAYRLLANLIALNAEEGKESSKKGF